MKHPEQMTSADIGRLVQAARKRQGLTQLQLAGMAETGIRLISDLENGKETVQIQKILKVVQALGLGLFIFSPWENI